MRYTEDILRIVKILNNNGYYATEELAQKIWSDYSEDVCAGWLILPEKDSDLLEILVEYGELEGLNKRRTRDLKDLSDIFLDYGKNDIRLGQAIYNAMRKQDIDLYSIENDYLLKLLRKNLQILSYKDF